MKYCIAFILFTFAASAQMPFTFSDVSFLGQDATHSSGSSGAADSPDDIAGLKIWLKNESLTMTNEGGGVWYWPDSSGNNYHATNNTEAQWPYLTNTFNGSGSLKAIVNDASTKVLYCSNAVGIIRNVTSCSIFVVARQNNTGASKPMIGFRNASGDARAYVGTLNSERAFGTAATVDGDSMLTVSSPTASSATDAICYHVQFYFTNATLNVFTNNVQAATGSGTMTSGNTSDTDCSYVAIGRNHSTLYFSGEIGEVIVYVPVISTSDATVVYNYLDAKFGL